MFMCETPGIWGSLPKGYGHLWEHVDVFITEKLSSYDDFEFDKGTCL